MPETTAQSTAVGGIRLTLESAIAIIGIVGVVLPKVTFPWRILCVLIVLTPLIDLIFHHPHTRRFSPGLRLAASGLVISLSVSALWHPLERQYLEEYAPPSFIYLVPGIWSPSPTPRWLMIIQHFGSQPVFNSELTFVDSDRGKAIAHKGTATPQDIEEEQLILRLAEIDPPHGEWAKHFWWSPLDPDHEHYVTGIATRDGQYHEDLDVERIEGAWQFKIAITDVSTHEKIIDCQDFSADPAHLPKCFPDYTVLHAGEPHLPLEIPAENRVMFVAVVIYAFGFLCALYSLLALWLMGVTLAASSRVASSPNNAHES